MAKNDLVRRIDLQQFVAGGSATVGTGAAPHYFATYAVAALDSTPAEIAGADFVCDNVADEVEIALALASKIGGYSRVVLLSGTFTLGANVTFTYPNCTLEGQGAATKIDATGGYGIVLADACQISNLTITGSGLRTSTTSLIAGTSLAHLALDNVIMLDCPQYGMALTTCSKSTINNCTVDSIGTDSNSGNAYGLRLDTCTGITIDGCHFTDIANAASDWNYGISLNKCIDCLVDGVEIIGLINAPGVDSIGVASYSNYGIFIGDEAFGSDHGSGNIITGCEFTNLARPIFTMQDSLPITGCNFTNCDNLYVYSRFVNIVGNTFFGNDPAADQSTWFSSVAIYLNGYAAADNNLYCTITGNTITSYGLPVLYSPSFRGIGISLTAAHKNLIAGNTIAGNSHDTTYRGKGILFDEASHNHVVGNKISKSIDGTNSQEYAYQLTSGSTGNIIEDNDDSDGGELGVMSGTGTATRYYPGGWQGGSSTLTIASDAITVTQQYHQLLPQSGTTDTLSTINGGYDGALLILRPLTVGHTIQADEAGNLALGGSAITMTTQSPALLLVYDLTLTKWVAVNKIPAFTVGAGTIGATEIADGSITAVKLDPLAVTNGNMNYMTDGTIKGRALGAGTGHPDDLSGSDAAAIVQPYITLGSYTLDSLSDVTTPTPTNGDVVYRSAGVWVNSSLATLIAADPSTMSTTGTQVGATTSVQKFTKNVSAPWYDFPPDDGTNGEVFNDNSASIPAGWTTITASSFGSDTNLMYGFWSIYDNGASGSWRYKKQSAYTIESISANTYKSVTFGPILFQDSNLGDDVTYSFGVHAAANAAIYAYADLWWDFTNSLWKTRLRHQDGTTETSTSWVTLTTPQPLWIRLALRNNTNKTVRAYVGNLQYAPSHHMFASGDMTAITWGQVYVDMRSVRGSSGALDTVRIGGVDYSNIE